MKREVVWSFNVLIATIDGDYVILKIEHELMISWVAKSKSYSYSKTWLGSGIISFSITFSKTLQEVESWILASSLFHSIITEGKKNILKKKKIKRNGICLSKNFL